MIPIRPRRMTLRWRELIGCLAGLLLLASPASARQYALLVGVSDYPSLRADQQLGGPRNDVLLGRHFLGAAGFAVGDIRILANGLNEAHGAPTRLAILDELDALARKAGRGDFVYLQFGGHGSQQPVRRGHAAHEPDGLDEIFLPEDVGRWDGSTGRVKNALRDDEFGQRIAAIRARGAFVWAVFDTCHSGSLTRGDDATRPRSIAPESLGIPPRALDRATLRGGGTTSPQAAPGRAESAEGGYVYFYAAQPNEATPDTALPADDPQRKPYGLFTYTLAQVVQRHPGISYRQAGERLLQLYAARNVRVTPQFEGSGLDAPVFGQQPGEGLRQWPLLRDEAGLRIKAGALQQFGAGAIFAVHADAAAAANAEPLGYLRADRTEAMQSVLSTIAWRGKPTHFTLPTAAVARLVEPNLRFNLRVALPPKIPPGAAYARAAKVIDALRASGSAGLKLEWVSSGQPADVRLLLGGERGTPQLWLLPADGAWVRQGAGKTPSIRLDKSEAALRATLAQHLPRIAKAANLMRIAAAGAGNARIETRLSLLRSGVSQEIDHASIPELRAGDRLQLTVRNASLKPQDITVLGIDARHGISLLYPAARDEANRIHPRDTLHIPAAGEGEIVLNDRTVGRESLLVIAVEAEANSPTVNLGFLAQEALPATKGGEADDVTELFERAGFGGEEDAPTARGEAIGKTAIRLYQYRARGRY